MLVEILIMLVIVGAVLYVAQLLPIDATIKRIIQIVVVVAVIIYLLRLVAPSL